jgi:hypothetical protein
MLGLDVHSHRTTYLLTPFHRGEQRVVAGARMPEQHCVTTNILVRVTPKFANDHSAYLRHVWGATHSLHAGSTGITWDVVGFLAHPRGFAVAAGVRRNL